MIHLQDISLEQQQKMLDYIEFIAKESSEHTQNSDVFLNKWVLGLHKSKIWMSDDFNELCTWIEVVHCEVEISGG